MQESAPDLVSHATIAVQTSSHNSSWATASVIGGPAVATAAVSSPATSEFWLHMQHLSVVLGILLFVTGLVRFYWDAKKYYYNQKIGSGSGG